MEPGSAYIRIIPIIAKDAVVATTATAEEISTVLKTIGVVATDTHRAADWIEEQIPEPEWDKEASVQMWLTNAVAIAVAVVGITDPGFHWPSWTHTAIPVISGIVASFAHWVILKKAARNAQLVGVRSVLELDA